MKPNCLHVLVYILVFLASVTSTFAQQDFLLGGVIKDGENGGRVANAQVVNQRTGNFVLSSNLGLFQLKAAIGDTLLIIKSNYSDFTAAVTTTKDMIINLNRDRTLREVNIIGQSKKSELNDIKREYRNKGSFHQGKPPLLAFIFTPLTAVYELFGRTPKNARRFGRYYENEMEQSLVDGLFNERLVKMHTPLEGKDLDYFLVNYRPAYEKVRKWAEYDSVKYIKEAYKKYTEDLKANPGLTNFNLDSIKSVILREDSLKRIK